MYKHYKNGYWVNHKGKVKRVRNDKAVKVDIYTNKYGYKYFILFNSRDKEKIYVHRAVASLFVPQPSKSKYIVDHINRNKSDNRSINLRWVNHSGNMKNRDTWIRSKMVERSENPGKN